MKKCYLCGRKATFLRAYYESVYRYSCGDHRLLAKDQYTSNIAIVMFPFTKYDI